MVFQQHPEQTPGLRGTDPNLLSAVEADAIELHTWSSSADDILHPDRMIFDLDPDATAASSRRSTAATATSLHHQPRPA